MSYATHIDRISSRISQFVGVFYNMNKIVPRRILLLLYFSFILPHLTLHIEIWGAAPDCYINKLAIRQNKLLRAILNVDFENGRPLVETLEMYRNLGVLTLRNLFKLQLFRFMVNVINGNMPYFFNLLLRPHISTHNYHTRTRAFRHPLIVCEVERRAITHQMVILYDQTSPDSYFGSSVHVAVCKFKKALLSNQ